MFLKSNCLFRKNAEKWLYRPKSPPPHTSLGRRGDRHAHATRKCKCQSVDIQSDYVIRQLNCRKLNFNDINVIPVYLWCVINKYILTIHYCRIFFKIGSARKQNPRSDWYPPSDTTAPSLYPTRSLLTPVVQSEGTSLPLSTTL